ncbi:hypothetical protein FKP32DRAFT_1670362 [Trametes sanguinea]|nr:hypothetical protein FKP32DRAFT_1680563 [Trametes sanguinea]KAI9060902.1 hypothetical protein FKP32DRAFT_1678645 [Trametes sanguinea]KAI9061409.1 hypothetical protein FKP32DRAFT_1678145 [Trametes sanguinea]KAI9061513.1 hypothetical protein FKP32DRAFT_1678139 [Trametes sanguinea]KAI9063734.1 hypothetical protein FKP32DRAFT_1676162 [Trametes sanguinea]
MADPFPVGSHVFFLESGRARFGTVTKIETNEGVRMVVITIAKSDPPQFVTLPPTGVSMGIVPS